VQFIDIYTAEQKLQFSVETGLWSLTRL